MDSPHEVDLPGPTLSIVVDRKDGIIVGSLVFMMSPGDNHHWANVQNYIVDSDVLLQLYMTVRVDSKSYPSEGPPMTPICSICSNTRISSF